MISKLCTMVYTPVEIILFFYYLSPITGFLVTIFCVLFKLFDNWTKHTYCKFIKKLF